MACVLTRNLRCRRGGRRATGRGEARHTYRVGRRAAAGGPESGRCPFALRRHPCTATPAAVSAAISLPCGLRSVTRSEEHTSELQSLMPHIVCRLLLEKKKKLYRQLHTT